MKRWPQFSILNLILILASVSMALAWHLERSRHQLAEKELFTRAQNQQQNYQIALRAVNRKLSASVEAKHFERMLPAVESLDVLLDSRRRSVQAEIAFLFAEHRVNYPESNNAEVNAAIGSRVAKLVGSEVDYCRVLLDRATENADFDQTQLSQISEQLSHFEEEYGQLKKATE